MNVALKHGAIKIAADVFADAFTRPERVLYSRWVGDNVIVPDGPKAGELIDLSMSPFLTEIIDGMMPDNGINEIDIRKSAQTGFTLTLISLLCATTVLNPGAILVTQPTSGALSDFNRDKLSPALAQCKAVSGKLLSSSDHAGGNSTVTTKLFTGGFIKLAIASSAADLRSKTIRDALCDEIDQYPDDLDGQGPPMEMIVARQQAFEASGEWKRLCISTPTIKGQSEIDRRFHLGDQRYWMMSCPGCDKGRFHFEFKPENFKYNDQAPYQAFYVTPCCGTIIEYRDRMKIVRAGQWVPTSDCAPNRRSYHFDSFTSPVVLWDSIAEKYKAAEGKPSSMKGFTNLVLGLPFDVQGDAPDHERLMERRAPDLKRGRIPPRGVILVAGADVQGNGIYYCVRAFAPDGQNWPVDADFIEGATTDSRDGAFAQLREILLREWPDCFGGSRRIDMSAVDSGYRTHAVYSFCRDMSAHNIVPIKGDEGWNKPAFGIGTTVDINFNNQRIRNGTTRHAVGTWPLKADFYSDLKLKGRSAGSDADPRRYIHFAGWQDENYFKQITGEYLATENYRGRTRQVWKPVPGKENHLLDCEIYLRAVFWWLTDRLSASDWQSLSQDRNVSDHHLAPDMFAPEPVRMMEKDRNQTTEPQQLSDSESIWD